MKISRTMISLNTLVVSGLALVFMSCSREQPPAPQVNPTTQSETAERYAANAAGTEAGGTVVGRVVLKGKWQPQTISVSRDQEVCGKSKPDPALIVSSQGEVRSRG
jgi:hypothetical protein